MPSSLFSFDVYANLENVLMNKFLRNSLNSLENGFSLPFLFSYSVFLVVHNRRKPRYNERVEPLNSF